MSERSFGKIKFEKEKLPVVTGRSLEYYLQLLELDLGDFENKKILNVGAGVSNLNEELEKMKIKPQIVNLDLAYDKKKNDYKYINGKKISPDDIPKNAVLANMKELPFLPNKFDKTIYLWSLLWLKKQDKIKSLLEAYRVCKINGEIKIHPVSFIQEEKEVIKKYENFKISQPNFDMKKIIKDDQNNFIDFNLAEIEKLQIMIEGIKGKKTGTLTIKKTIDFSEEDLKQTLEELSSLGFAF